MRERVRRPRVRMGDRGLPGLLRRWALLVGTLLLSVLAADLALRLSGLEAQMVAKTLYYQGYDAQLHRVSAVPGLHYELTPGIVDQGGGGTTIHINRQGARGPEPPEPAPPGTWRILFYGASTLYGAGLADSETLAATLERHLQDCQDPSCAGRGEVPPRRYEVWNFGVSAYVLTQMALSAQHRLERHPADLILVLYSNRGRRAFLPDPSFETGGFRRWFREDPSLWVENYPTPVGVPEGLHRAGLRFSSLYRYQQAWERSRVPRIHPNESPEAEKRDTVEILALQAKAEALGIPVVLVAIPGWRGRLKWWEVFPGLPKERFIDLFQGGHPPAWYDDHPTASVMNQHATFLARELSRRGLLDQPPRVKK